MIRAPHLFDAGGHAFPRGECGRPAAKGHLVFGVVADGDDGVTDEADGDVERVARPGDHTRRDDVFLRRRRPGMLQTIEQPIERDTGDERRAAPVADGAAGHVDAHPVRDQPARRHVTRRRCAGPFEPRFCLCRVRLPRAQRGVARRGGRIRRSAQQKCNHRALEDPAIGRNEVRRAQQAHGDRVGNDRGNSQHSNQDPHQHDVSHNRGQPRRDVEPCKSCPAGLASVSPCPVLVPDEVVDYRELHGHGGRRQPRPRRQRRQGPEGEQLQDEAGRAYHREAPKPARHKGH